MSNNVYDAVNDLQSRCENYGKKIQEQVRIRKALFEDAEEFNFYLKHDDYLSLDSPLKEMQYKSIRLEQLERDCTGEVQKINWLLTKYPDLKHHKISRENKFVRIFREAFPHMWEE